MTTGYDNWDQKYNALSTLDKYAPHTIDYEDKKWLERQNEALQYRNNRDAINKGSKGYSGSAGDDLMQQRGWLARLTGWGVPKVNKYDY